MPALLCHRPKVCKEWLVCLWTLHFAASSSDEVPEEESEILARIDWSDPIFTEEEPLFQDWFLDPDADLPEDLDSLEDPVQSDQSDFEGSLASGQSSGKHLHEAKVFQPAGDLQGDQQTSAESPSSEGGTSASDSPQPSVVIHHLPERKMQESHAQEGGEVIRHSLLDGLSPGGLSAIPPTVTFLFSIAKDRAEYMPRLRGCLFPRSGRPFHERLLSQPWAKLTASGFAISKGIRTASLLSRAYRAARGTSSTVQRKSCLKLSDNCSPSSNNVRRPKGAKKETRFPTEITVPYQQGI